ncbi:hypothetical protein OH491_16540 [Termitidicoccus mucosus]
MSEFLFRLSHAQTAPFPACMKTAANASWSRGGFIQSYPDNNYECAWFSDQYHSHEQQQIPFNRAGSGPVYSI